MSSMIAKFRVSNVTTISESCEQLELSAVSEKPFDGDGKSDDNDFARWTPTGELKMSITNPNLIGKFKVGEKFYLNFTPADS